MTCDYRAAESATTHLGRLARCSTRLGLGGRVCRVVDCLLATALFVCERHGSVCKLADRLVSRPICRTSDKESAPKLCKISSVSLHLTQIE